MSFNQTNMCSTQRALLFILTSNWLLVKEIMKWYMDSRHWIVSITMFKTRAEKMDFLLFQITFGHFKNFALLKLKIYLVNLLARFCLLFISNEKTKIKTKTEKKWIDNLLPLLKCIPLLIAQTRIILLFTLLYFVFS